MTTSHWMRPHSFRTSDLSTDVLIIGGGYAGLSTAYWLTELRPDLKITILDRQSVAAGASGRNAGFLTKGSAVFYRTLSQEWGPERARRICQFAETSIDLVHNQILKSSPEIKFEKTTSMTLLGAEELGGFDPSEFNFARVTGQDLPETLNSTFFCGYESGPEYKINPIQLMHTLKKLLEGRKVQVIECVGAFNLTADSVLTEINQIKANKVVLALNGYLPQFHPAFKELIIPQRAQMLAVEVPAGFNCPSLYYDPLGRVYWRKTGDNMLLIGGKRLLDEEGEVGDFDRLSPTIQEGLEDYLKGKLKLEYKVINRWSGIMGFTQHELPFIGRVDAPVETFLLGGFSGHGMGLGFHSGKEMAELVCGERERSFFDDFKELRLKL